MLAVNQDALGIQASAVAEAGFGEVIAKKLADSAVPMSLLADHPNVQFNFYRGGIGSTESEMH